MNNTDKRSVKTDALETLGKLIDETARRDAIHLAVEPAMAGQHLDPGQDVGIRDGMAFKYMEHEKTPVKLVGIVDPFLKHGIRKGQMFWLIVYPRTITSLRHVWSHPDFEEKTQASEGGLYQRVISEQWLRNFCDTADCPRYETVLAAVLEGEYDDYLHFDGRDAHGSIPSEFWDHMEVVTGRKITERPQYFSCSC